MATVQNSLMNSIKNFLLQQQQQLQKKLSPSLDYQFDRWLHHLIVDFIQWMISSQFICFEKSIMFPKLKKEVQNTGICYGNNLSIIIYLESIKLNTRITIIAIMTWHFSSNSFFHWRFIRYKLFSIVVFVFMICVKLIYSIIFSIFVYRLNWF